MLGDAFHEGPRNYQGFRDCVEAYFRSLIGATGKGVHVGPGASSIVMSNNTFNTPAECSYRAG